MELLPEKTGTARTLAAVTARASRALVSPSYKLEKDLNSILSGTTTLKAEINFISWITDL